MECSPEAWSGPGDSCPAFPALEQVLCQQHTSWQVQAGAGRYGQVRAGAGRSGCLQKSPTCSEPACMTYSAGLPCFTSEFAFLPVPYGIFCSFSSLKTTFTRRGKKNNFSFKIFHHSFLLAFFFLLSLFLFFVFLLSRVSLLQRPMLDKRFCYVLRGSLRDGTCLPLFSQTSRLLTSYNHSSWHLKSIM